METGQLALGDYLRYGRQMILDGFGLPAGLLEPFDIILDCTDNAPTRYLLSDTAVALRKPLVSGAAQKFDGQLCTYNFGDEGPCYRCLFPRPPSPEMTGSCQELGILGAVTGIIGNMQALEAIKIITGLHDGKPSLLTFSALSAPPFRSFKLRRRRENCPACGLEGIRIGSIAETDYVAFCGGHQPDWESRGMEENTSDARINAKTRLGIVVHHLTSDVPLKELVSDPLSHAPSNQESDTYVVCRLGNDSQIAVEAMRNAGMTGVIKDVVGGLKAWSRDVDKTFPVY
ncbi:hypothetical protein PHLCEN_2v5099 [Hermanssonia centrifuga]|uniref:Rhodanese domain-containing protein n=1 Tax=Hermanssonia centrifuga TaxID=98765 RepID=A0A2R6PC33_9APHY|nr:hypothetical protein PHLCEN_2v5099 [Hermanssonia centrifuga]